MGAGSMCGEVYPVGHVDGFRNVRVTSLFHREAGMMALLINWLGFVERDLASGSAGGPARVASLSLAKREVKREARKRVRGGQKNLTSLRSLVLSLIVCCLWLQLAQDNILVKGRLLVLSFVLFPLPLSLPPLFFLSPSSPPSPSSLSVSLGLQVAPRQRSCKGGVVS